MKVVNRATGENLFNALKESLQRDGIPFANLVGFGSDNAANMIGVRNSVWSRIKDAQPHAYLTGCVCHIAATCASDACKTLPDYVETMVTDIFSYFYKSSVRTEKLMEYAEFCSEFNPKKLLRPCQTRWLSLQAVVERTLEKLPSLRAYFASEELDVKAKEIKKTLNKPLVELYLIFLKETLPYFNKFNLKFQSKTPNIHMLASEIEVLIRAFMANFLKMDIINKVDSHQLYDEDLLCEDNWKEVPKLGICLSGKLKELVEEGAMNNSERKLFLRDITKFYSRASASLLKKLPTVTDSVLGNLKMLQPRSEIDYTAVELAKRFPQVVSEEELPLLMDEVGIYDSNKALLPEINDVENYWNRVGNVKNGEGEHRFPSLFKLAKALLVLPHGNADVERLFSHVSLIKTSKRNLLANETINNILHAKCNSHSACHEFVPPLRSVKLVKGATAAHVAKRKSKSAATCSVDDSEPEESGGSKRSCQTSITQFLGKRQRKTPPSTDFITCDFVVEDQADDSEDSL